MLLTAGALKMVEKKCIICFCDLIKKSTLFSIKTYDVINVCSNLLELKSQETCRELHKIFFCSDLKIEEFFCELCKSLIENYKKLIKEVEGKENIEPKQKDMIYNIKSQFLQSLENNFSGEFELEEKDEIEIDKSWLEAAEEARRLILMDLCYITETIWEIEDFNLTEANKNKNDENTQIDMDEDEDQSADEKAVEPSSEEFMPDKDGDDDVNMAIGIDPEVSHYESTDTDSQESLPEIYPSVEIHTDEGELEVEESETIDIDDMPTPHLPPLQLMAPPTTLKKVGFKKKNGFQKNFYDFPLDVDYKLCKFCGQKFTGRTKYFGHQFRYHEGDKYFNCDQCDALEGSMHHLEVHKVNFHGKAQKKYDCEFCEKIYTNSSGLKKHVELNHLALEEVDDTTSSNNDDNYEDIADNENDNEENVSNKENEIDEKYDEDDGKVKMKIDNEMPELKVEIEFEVEKEEFSKKLGQMENNGQIKIKRRRGRPCKYPKIVGDGGPPILKKYMTLTNKQNHKSRGQGQQIRRSGRSQVKIDPGLGHRHAKSQSQIQKDKKVITSTSSRRRRYNFPLIENYRNCMLCINTAFKSREKYFTHKFLRHGGAKYFNCSQCKAVEGSSYALNSHKIKYHGKNSKNPKKYANIEKVHQIGKKEKGEKVAKKESYCEFCLVEFESKYAVQTHIKKVHGRRREMSKIVKFQVKQPKKQTPMKRQIKKEKVDSPKEFECQICQMVFYHHSNLSMHKKTHYKSPKKALIKSKVKEANDNEKPFQCDLCQTKYTKKCNLVRHNRKQHSELSVKGIKEDQNENEVQVKVKNGNEGKKSLFVCKLCPEAFRDETDLKKHYYLDHISTLNFNYQKEN